MNIMTKIYQLKHFLVWIIIVFNATHSDAQTMKPEDTEVWHPEPKLVTPGKNNLPPSDAIVLFDGTNLNEWRSVKDGSAPKWTIAQGAFTVTKGAGTIETKRLFGDCQLHLEWKSPVDTTGFRGQDRGNSGVFLASRYEIQILDSYGNRTYSNGQAGSVYKQHIPLVNACLPAGEWQTYDIFYTAPKFNATGQVLTPAYVSVIHNGILIQNHVEIKGTIRYIGLPSYENHGKAPIQLQDHDHPVSFRNVWIREL